MSGIQHTAFVLYSAFSLRKERRMPRHEPATRLIVVCTLSAIAAIGCSTPNAPAPPSQAAPAAAPATRNSHQDWPTGDYKVVEGWPKPLPDTRHSHAGWTWGSFGGVYAENPDRIW